MKSKKGAEKMLSIYWFLILTIVAFGIWAMAYAFYSHPSDIREVEVRILSNKIADCIAEAGNINENFFDEQGQFKTLTKDNFESLCHFTFEVEDQYDWRQKYQYYLQINFFDATKKPKFSEIIFGEPQIKSFCEKGVETGQDFERLPKCVTRRFYALDKENKQTLIEIYSGISKVEKNVKI